MDLDRDVDLGGPGTGIGQVKEIVMKRLRRDGENDGSAKLDEEEWIEMEKVMKMETERSNLFNTGVTGM